MSESARRLFSDDFLRSEIERTIFEYRWAFEGERETTTDTGDALIHELEVPWFSNHGFLGRFSFDPESVDARIDQLVADLTGEGRSFVWVVGPSARPADLTERLVAHGVPHVITWNGMALRDIQQPIDANPEIVVEQLSESNAEAYAALCADMGPDPAVKEERLAAARRLIAAGQKDAQPFIAFLEGTAISCAVLRCEETGVAYLRNAVTREEYRNRGAYLALIKARLDFARHAGCGAAVVQAQVQSSSPTLRKRGFETLCQLNGLISAPSQQ